MLLPMPEQLKDLSRDDRTDVPDAPVTMSWRYELDSSGQRLTATERMRGGGRDQDNVWVFDRR